MEIQVTEKGARDKDGNRIPVGTKFEVEAIPSHLVNKCRSVGELPAEDGEDDEDEKAAVTNPAKGGGVKDKAK